MEQDIRYLTLLSREFPSVQSACAEIKDQYNAYIEEMKAGTFMK